MRPLRLLLDGFASYRQPADVDFTDVDFFALTGPTGSGKSTLVDGLCFALYGTVPRWGKENAIAHALAPAANACRVCLIFEANGRRYAAVRALTRDKKGKVHTREARLELLSPDVAADAAIADLLGASVQPLAEGPDEVKAQVQEILGLSYEHFTQSVLLPQGQFAEFLQAKPGDRQDLLVQLLAFGVYDTVGQRARERAKLATSAAEHAQRERDELGFATPAAEAQLTAHVDRLTELESAIGGRLRTLGELRRSEGETAQEATRYRAVVKLLADVAVPGPVPGLARRIAGADGQIEDAARQLAEAEQAEMAAERAADQLPDRAELETLLARHRERRELAARLTEQDAAAATAVQAEQEKAGALGAAEEALRDATYALEEARDAHAAAHLASGLTAGRPCPVCLRPVGDLPQHPAPVALDEAETAVARAERQVRAARDAARKATREAATARGTAAATRERLDSVRTADGEAGGPALHERLAAIDAAAGQLRAARESARQRRATARSAQQDRQSLTEAEQQAWAAFRRTRDALVALDAPAADATDLAAAWQALAAWTADRRAAAELRLRETEARAAELRHQVSAEQAAISGVLAEAGLHEVDVTDPMRVAGAVAAERTKAQGDLDALRTAMRRVVRLDERIAAHREEGQVATMLGNLLRATSFERWLCGEALDALVADASQTLMELSGGQYQLDRDDRNELVVIDYQDAAASRPVHTLSGGETFQASLALALALSRQVAGLSAGRRDLNSMFLDEGFGTLDEDTLETVAATLERLAADSDRMVGVITHVPALAERVPVRFVVSRDAGTSSIRKERA